MFYLRLLLMTIPINMIKDTIYAGLLLLFSNIFLEIIFFSSSNTYPIQIYIDPFHIYFSNISKPIYMYIQPFLHTELCTCNRS